jgi:hypothetical protein
VENRKILDIIKSQEAGRSQHDQFHAQVCSSLSVILFNRSLIYQVFSANLSFIFQLEKAEDGFSIIAEYFGRGLFSQPTPLPDVRKAPPQKRQVNKCLHIYRCIHLKRKTYAELTLGTS